MPWPWTWLVTLKILSIKVLTKICLFYWYYFQNFTAYNKDFDLPHDCGIFYEAMLNCDPFLEDSKFSAY